MKSRYIQIAGPWDNRHLDYRLIGDSLVEEPVRFCAQRREGPPAPVYDMVVDGERHRKGLLCPAWVQVDTVIWVRQERGAFLGIWDGEKKLADGPGDDLAQPRAAWAVACQPYRVMEILPEALNECGYLGIVHLVSLR